ncbi:cytochrome C oxidase subunit IV family protein [Afifella marina]|uniref:Cytochrome C oxidase subunit IV n=1 Tax=Afifella marina DSM 2698 TaxID=1120955 RepID=A0A1G5P4G2_AFIMA|nr:cytochrome C oxidase subunit IV family protein [Afifella marina]SCZ44425.1 Cytochrome C oxidase subunit IV [Afifella marina DSM 2698]
MRGIDLAWFALVALTLLSLGTSGVAGALSPALILAVAAAKAITVLRWFLEIGEASRGWRLLLDVYVVAICATIAGIFVIAGQFAAAG